MDLQRKEYHLIFKMQKLILFLFLFSYFLFSEIFSIDKKIIHHGWSWLTPEILREKIRNIENSTPFFDGVVIRLKDILPFKKKKINEGIYKEDIENLKNTDFKIFKDNFLIVFSGGIKDEKEEWDWFNEKDIESSAYNWGLLAKIAKEVGCKGLIFDPEVYYGIKIFNYNSLINKNEKTFEEYYNQVRKAGRKIMSSIQKEYPNIVLFFLFGNSIFTGNVYSMDVKILSQHPYGLLPAFINGILDVINPEVLLIDGNEPSYWYRKPEDFYTAYHIIKEGSILLVAPENREKYKRQVRVSFGIYPDLYYGFYKSFVGGSIPGEMERAKWYEHNIYWGLKVCDEYIWNYAEKIDWYGIQEKQPWCNYVPKGAKDAIISAKRKIQTGKELEFNILEVLKNKLMIRNMKVEKIDRQIEIDGRLEPFIMEKIKNLPDFVGRFSEVEKGIQCQTKVWCGYDEKYLYICFYNEEPSISEVQVYGEERDEDIWKGDCVEIFITKYNFLYPYYHFIVNLSNIQYDAININGNEDKAWNGKWESAVFKGENYWTVEIKIPFAEIGGFISERRANFCRVRKTKKESSLATWSQIISWFNEPENFGILNFKE